MPDLLSLESRLGVLAKTVQIYADGEEGQPGHADGEAAQRLRRQVDVALVQMQGARELLGAVERLVSAAERLLDEVATQPPCPPTNAR